jgi:hypothetical protein
LRSFANHEIGELRHERALVLANAGRGATFCSSP